MTRFSLKSARKTDEAKVRKAWGLDPFFYEILAKEALLFRSNLSFPREKLHALGLLALAIVSNWEKSLKENSVGEKKAEELANEVKTLLKHGPSVILHDLEKLLELTSFHATSRRRRNTFEIGTDGHPLTREAAANLNLARHYELISEDFGILISRVFASLTRYGQAYCAWEKRLPLLICNLEKEEHVRVARELIRIEPSGIGLVSRAIPQGVRILFANEIESQELFLIEDKENLFQTILGIENRDIFLLERRLGGWTLTYPLGNPSEKALYSRKIPVWAREMARSNITGMVSPKETTP